jgi:tubulin alpha
MMQPLVSIGVGQAGVQQTDALWQLMCAEHGVGECGLLDAGEQCGGDVRQRLFQRTRVDRLVPHCVLVDTDADAIDALRRGPRRDLYHPARLLHGVDGRDGSSTFAAAQTVGRARVLHTLDTVRLLLEQCDAPCAGLLLARASGGGTGAGLGSLLLQSCADDEFGDSVPLIDLCTVPSERLGDAVTAPYNAVFAACDSMAHAAACVLFENEAMYRCCTDALHVRSPDYAQLNQVWAHVVSSVTAPFRFDKTATAHLGNACRALTKPFRNFLVPHFAPLLPRRQIEHERLLPVDLTRHIFDARCSQTSADVLRGRSTIGAWLIYRGISEDDTRSTSAALADALSAFPSLAGEPTLRYSHVEQVSCGVAGGVVAPAPRSLCALTNSSASARILRAQLRKFDRLLSKRAFLHWYEAEGIELADFVEARNIVYQSVQ